ncbi:OmpA family protein [Halovulum sp. GXIMD14794]
MTIVKLPLALTATAALGLAACTNPDGTTDNTSTGVLAGATLGALAGGLIGDDAKGAAIGGIAGAAVGAGVGALLDRQQRELQQDLAGSGAKIINTGSQLIVSLPEAITFDVDSTVVKPNSVSNIAAIARNLQDYPNSTVQVIGHTDNTGSASYNQDLSVRRASAVANVLFSNGVRQNRVRIIGQGQTQPIASNNTVDGRAQNRRVEIVITPTA